MHRPRPPKLLPFGAGARQAGMDTLFNDRRLELRKSRNHRKEKLARRRRGVDVLIKDAEIDSQRAKLIERIDQVLDASPEAVQSIDQEDVESASSGQAHNLDKLRPLVGRPRIAVIDPLPDNLPSSFLRKLS